MMMRALLWRGLFAGFVGAFVAATFAWLVAEPQIDAAIALEARHAAHAGAIGDELVSRATQRTWGLFTAMALYGTAMGGLLAIVFAGMYGRVARIGPRGLALALGLAAFAVIALIPAVKYPPTPPAVGLHETVRLRTAAYFAMIAVSTLAAIGASWTQQRLARRLSGIDRLLVAIVVYLGTVLVVQWLLPSVDEVPADFPATLLWRFRLAALATQALFWLVAADLFGRWSERSLLTRQSR
ncbi:CbtA family protein [uncultured Sphingomonas sp.]|uniref:CbtA family protein n=1 Tax=uncultured Sphingomonas sp. TaxID=158754 RepID=UPI0025CECCD5|nr:CbtA family protein [uncultured Sphingomonas sp.]